MEKTTLSIADMLRTQTRLEHDIGRKKVTLLVRHPHGGTVTTETLGKDRRAKNEVIGAPFSCSTFAPTRL